MPTWLSLAVSCLALVVSAVTAWLTFFRKGRLVMTQPTTVFFGPDGPMFERGKNKVYLRTLLYSTAKRGHVLESLYLSLHRNEAKQNFNIWVYGEKGDLKRGSGLFVPPEGVTFDHLGSLCGSNGVQSHALGNRQSSAPSNGFVRVLWLRENCTVRRVCERSYEHLL
jgi:hypothetical protein